MPRSSLRFLPLAGSLAALAVAAPALGADTFSGLRPSYTGAIEETPLRFETGVRYWYSWGGQSFSIGGDTEDIESTAHAGEFHFRIDDDYTSTFLKGNIGYSVAGEGSVSTNGGPSEAAGNVRLGYVGADFGWPAFGNAGQGFSFGPVVGYSYLYDTADTGRANYTTAASLGDITWSDSTGAWAVGFDSQPNDLHFHTSRIGVAGRADLGDSVDITGELLAIPYAWVSGVYGAYAVADGGGPGYTSLHGSPTTISGHAYGAAGELMVGFHPTDSLTIRIGGRATYLQGAYDATYERATIVHPVERPYVPVPDSDPVVLVPDDPRYDPPEIMRQGFIETNNPFSMFRYGALLEITGRF